MRSKEQIMQELSDKLSGQEYGAWARIKNSLIGKELLAYGAEVVMASDTVADTLSSIFDYNVADASSLITMSHVYGFPISFTKPSWIKIHIVSPSVVSFNPYDIKLIFGNSTFYNIGYCTSNDDIVLYQGQLKSTFDTEFLSIFASSGEVVPVSWSKTTLSVSETNVLSGNLLGDVVPESVFYFIKTVSPSRIELIPQVTPLRYGSAIQAYKLYTLMDGNTMTVDGDGVWASLYSPADEHNIIWLQPTTNTFETSASGQVSIKGVSYDYSILSTGNAETNSLEYARELFRRYFLETSAIVSEKQIRDYVNSFPYILDSAVEAINNLITVRVKPTQQGDTSKYGDIEAELDIHGMLTTKHEVINGTPLEFQFALHSYYPIDSALKSSISDYLASKFSYSNMKYDTIVDVNSVQVEIASLYGVSCSVAFNCGVQITGNDVLNFVPVQGTIQVYESESSTLYKGQDQNGSFLMGTSSQEQVNCSPYLGTIGDFVVSTGKSFKLVDASGTLQMIRYTSPSYENCEITTHNGYVYSYDTKLASVDVYSLMNVQNSADLSKAPSVLGAQPVFVRDYSDAFKVIPLYYKNQVYMVYFDSLGNIAIDFYTSGNSDPYYTFIMPVSAQRLVGIQVGLEEILVYFTVSTGNASVTKAAVVKYLESSQASYTVCNVDMSALQLPSSEIVAFSALSEGYYAVSVKTQSQDSFTITSVPFSYSSVSSNEVAFSGKLGSGYTYTATGGSSYSNWILARLQDFILIKFTIVGTPIRDSVIAVDLQGQEYPLNGDDTYNVLSNDTAVTVGSVNYQTGVVNAPSIGGSYLRYLSRQVIVSKNNYLQLSSTPVVWI